MITTHVQVRDVMAATGLSYNGVLKHIKAGHLPATSFGGTYAISVEHYRAFLTARATGRFTRQWKAAAMEARS